ncbi:hypothetical protein [Dactylosporangium sp. NPDC049140]|jgi:hypothetical protein|uniref:hypothetical protein n=1 Tax=Dactylosporangium sp. NPDC049140 TaxID=3155647 RepID=UPI00340E0189
MRWTLIIRREPMDVRYERVPQHLLMGLIQGHVIEGRVHGVEAVPEVEESAPARCPLRQAA